MQFQLKVSRYYGLARASQSQSNLFALLLLYPLQAGVDHCDCKEKDENNKSKVTVRIVVTDSLRGSQRFVAMYLGMVMMNTAGLIIIEMELKTVPYALPFPFT